MEFLNQNAGALGLFLTLLAQIVWGAWITGKYAARADDQEKRNEEQKKRNDLVDVEIDGLLKMLKPIAVLEDRIEGMQRWIEKNDRTNERLAILENEQKNQREMLSDIRTGQLNTNSMLGKLLDKKK